MYIPGEEDITESTQSNIPKGKGRAKPQENVSGSSSSTSASSSSSDTSSASSTSPNAGSNSSAPGDESMLFVEDAFFAVKNRHVELLSLLLGLDHESLMQLHALLAVLDKEWLELHAELGKNRANTSLKVERLAWVLGKKLNNEKLNVDEVLGEAEECLQDGNVLVGIKENGYEEKINEQIKSDMDSDKQHKTRLISGEFITLPNEDRKDNLEKLKEKYQQDKKDYLASPSTKKEIATDRGEMLNLVKEIKRLKAEGETIVRKQFENKELKANMEAEVREIRDTLISQISQNASSNPACIPQRYRSTINGENKGLKELLLKAAGAVQDMRVRDRARRTMMYYALEKRDVNLEIVKLIFTHGGIDTLLCPEDRENQPYNFVVLYANNDVERLIREYYTRDIVATSEFSLVYHTENSLVKVSEVEGDMLNKAEAGLEGYLKILGGRSGRFNIESFTLQRMEICKRLLLEVIPAARSAKNWLMYESVAKSIIPEIRVINYFFFFKKSALRDLLVESIALGEKAFGDLPRNSLAQLRHFMDERVAIQARESARAAAEAEYNETVNVLRREVGEWKQKCEEMEREWKREKEESKREKEESKREKEESKREKEESKREKEESKREMEESKREMEEQKQKYEQKDQKREEAMRAFQERIEAMVRPVEKEKNGSQGGPSDLDRGQGFTPGYDSTQNKQSSDHSEKERVNNNI